MLLGLDIGGTKCACILGDREGNILQREAWPTAAERGPDLIIEDLIKKGEKAVKAGGRVESVGVSIGGPLDAINGVVMSPPNLPGWDRIRLRRILSNALKLPVHVHHDAAACALAEARWGVGRGLNTVGYLTCGTGFGLGMVINGKPYYGAGGYAPEFGHVRLTDDGPVGFGVPGSAEGWCAGPGIARIAAWRFPDRWLSGSIDPKEIGRLALLGDPDATEVINEHGEKTGMACAIVADIFHPEIIALGSLARYLGKAWFEAVHSGYHQNTLKTTTGLTQIMPAGLGENLQDLSTLASAYMADT